MIDYALAVCVCLSGQVLTRVYMTLHVLAVAILAQLMFLSSQIYEVGLA